ncbi:MAG: cation diffusion facilitator family transporter, partial [Alphaproteobacteria bacterium]
ATMLASLLDTLGDGVITLIAYFSLRISMMPADEDHRFGHGKAEGFSALIQASFLVGAAVFLMFESFMRLFRPVEIDYHLLGIWVSILAIIASLLIIAVQSFTLRKIDSLIIEADQRHYMNDVLINGAAILGLGAHYYWGLGFVDSILGLVIALYICWTGFQIGIKATDMLMDKEIGENERARIKEIVFANKQVKGMHDLRTRRTGMNVSLSFDVELDPALTLHDAHAIVRELEFALLEDFPHADIIIHMDPEGDTYDSRHKVQGVHH